MITSPAIEKFRTLPDKISAVRKALSDPHVVEALLLIDLANKPVACNDPVIGLHPDQVVSRKYHVMLGVEKAIATLRSMGEPPQVRPEKTEALEPDFSSEVDPSLFPDEPALPQ